VREGDRRQTDGQTDHAIEKECAACVKVISPNIMVKGVYITS